MVRLINIGWGGISQYSKSPWNSDQDILYWFMRCYVSVEDFPRAGVSTFGEWGRFRQGKLVNPVGERQRASVLRRGAPEMVIVVKEFSTLFCFT